MRRKSRWLLITGGVAALCLVIGLLLSNLGGGETKVERRIERLYALKRRVTVMRHAVGPLLEVVGKLHGGRVPQVCSASGEYFRDVSDHLQRINGTLDALRDTIGTAIQVNLSMVTIEESETTKQLAAWAGIFAVATAFVGSYGTAALAGYGVAARLEYILVPIAFGFGTALTAMVATNMGAGNPRRALRVAARCAGRAAHRRACACTCAD